MSLLSIADLDNDAMRAILDLGAAVKRDPDSYRSALTGKSVGLFFMKQSLRTWVSCDVAAIQVGMHPIVIRNDQTGMGTREDPRDVGQVLDRYLDAIGLRVFDHADLVAIDEATEMPVINLLSDLEHPCQAIADLMTVAEHVEPSSSHIAFVGDGNNVCHSLMYAAALTGAEIRVCTPPGYRPLDEVVDFVQPKTSLWVGSDPVEAVRGADVVYTDVWSSMGQEDEAGERRHVFEPYRVDEELFGLAKDDAIFLHCLPAHRGEEVTSGVIDHERSRVFDQAENRLHAFKAILLHLLG